MDTRSVPQGPATATSDSLRNVALVIDDELDIRELLGRVLAKCGYRVVTAENGETGLALAREHDLQIGLALLDLSLPTISGAAVLAQLRRARPDLRVILTSGCAQEEAIARLGATPELLRNLEFIQKPFSIPALMRQVTAPADH